LAEANALNSLRWAVKRLVLGERFKWLEAPARTAWFYARTVGDARHLPRFYSGFKPQFRDQPLATQVDALFDGFGGLFRPFQNRNELRRLAEYLAEQRPRVVMEIGTARGGTLYMLSRAAHPEAEIISLDLPAGLYGGGYPAWKAALYRRMIAPSQKLTLLRMDSHTDSAFQAAKAALAETRADFLFIDGDHSYEGAKADFQRYRSLVRPGGLIGFHDILPSKIDHKINVSPLWSEIKAKYETREFVDAPDQGQFGIGVMTVPISWD
jgi:predicted O-methyltransferase YrrM